MRYVGIMDALATFIPASASIIPTYLIQNILSKCPHFSPIQRFTNYHSSFFPARLKNEMKRLGEFIVAGKDISSDEELAKHADWVETFIGSYDSVTEENVEEILQKEIGEVFKKVLEHAGVYKNTKQGMEGFMRFISGL